MLAVEVERLTGHSLRIHKKKFRNGLFVLNFLKHSTSRFSKNLQKEGFPRQCTSTAVYTYQKTYSGLLVTTFIV
jgi:hypothetical protein